MEGGEATVRIKGAKYLFYRKKRKSGLRLSELMFATYKFEILNNLNKIITLIW
jgi:hypothetical protein